MKTKSHTNNYFVKIRLPEIITWIIGLVVFMILIFGLNLNAQDHTLYRQDTIILRTGVIIPCLVLYDVTQSGTIKIVEEDSIGLPKNTEYSLTQISSFSIHSTQKERKGARRSLHAPKTIRLFVAFGGGFPRTLGISTNILFKNDLGGSISYRYRAVKSNSEPSDYHSGIFLLPFEPPRDEVTMLSVCFMKTFTNPTRKRIRFGIEAGPSLVRYSVVNFTKRSSFLGSNYVVSYKENVALGLLLRLKVELPVTKYFGFEIAATGNLNAVQSFASLELYLTFGKLRD
jgi:hypothetical protein